MTQKFLLIILFCLSTSIQAQNRQRFDGGMMVHTGYLQNHFSVLEGMHCNHCKATCEQSVGKVKGVTSLRRFYFVRIIEKSLPLQSKLLLLPLWAPPSVY